MSFFSVAPASAPWSSPPASTAYSLPSAVGLGAATIHRYDEPRVSPSRISVSVYVPIPTAGVGYELDMQAKQLREVLPDRCVIGDGGKTRAFLGIDKRPGTPLSQRLDAIVRAIPDTSTPETIVTWARDHIQDYLKFPPGNHNDGAPQLSWDLAIRVGPTAASAMNAVAVDPVGAPARASNEMLPVVALERYLERGEGYCIQMATLASLVLERCRVPHKIVQGAVRLLPGVTIGHTWLELADGRLLDVAAQVLGPKGQTDPVQPSHFMFNGNYRFANQRFPYLGLS